MRKTLYMQYQQTITLMKCLHIPEIPTQMLCYHAVKVHNPSVNYSLQKSYSCQLPLHVNQPARAEELFRRRNMKLQVFGNPLLFGTSALPQPLVMISEHVKFNNYFLNVLIEQKKIILVHKFSHCNAAVLQQIIQQLSLSVVFWRETSQHHNFASSCIHSQSC